MSTAGKRLLGIGAIVALVLLIVLGVSKPAPFAEKHTYYAVFDSVHGLGQIDRDVRIAGLKMGEIGEVKRDGDDVRAELILFDDFTVHEDARADMRPHTLFEGSNFVDFFPGSPSAPVIEEGSTIPAEQTSNYVTLDEALRILKPDIRENLRDLAKVGSKTLRGKGIAGVQRTLKGAPTLVKELAPAARAAQGPKARELAGTVKGVSQTVDAVAEKEDQLIPVVRRLNRTAAALSVDGGAPLDATLAALPGALRELRDSAPGLTTVFQRLDRLSGEITPALPELTVALRDTTPVLNRALPVLRDATPLIRDTRLVASRLAKAKGGLVRMFNLIDGSLNQFQDFLEVANAPTRLGAPAVRQLVAGAFTGLDAVFRTYQTRAQNPNAPGHQLRIGTYFDPEAFAGLGDLLGAGGLTSPVAGGALADCDDVAQVSGRAAKQLRAFGGCL